MSEPPDQEQGAVQTEARGNTDPVYIAGGRYRVVARVGVGGTAIVYRCIDEHTGRIVAVKVMRSNGSQIQEAAARFWREARLAASLSHRNIVRVLDFGYSSDPLPGQVAPWPAQNDERVPYLAMEYIFGPNLKDIVRHASPLPLAWVYILGDQLCDALTAAHQMSVVHRDVKPQNVMLVDSQVELLAKLGDFGIARQVGGDYTALTVTGQVLGTPDYLAPEQVMGEPGGPQSDLYSLGIVLFELITGRLPFEADTPLAAASRRMVGLPPRPRDFRRDTPADLEEVVLWALRREPEQRPHDVKELAAALQWARSRGPAWDEAERRDWLAVSPASRPRGITPPKTTNPMPPNAANQSS